MKRVTSIATFVVAASVSFMAQASSYYNGGVCQPTNASRNNIDYNQWGPHSITSSSVTVECPLPISISGAAQTVSSVLVTVWDGHSSSNVSCTLRQVDTLGSTIWSASRNSSGVSSALLSFSVPNLSASGGFWVMKCTLPGAQNGNYSHVTSISIP